jgi:hypothetical protein
MTPVLSGGADVRAQVFTTPPDPYILTVGPYIGKCLNGVPASYLRSLEVDEYAMRNHIGLREAFVHHCSRGVRRYGIENYRLESGSYKGWLLRDVPKQYRKQLVRDVATLEKHEMLGHALRYENHKAKQSNAVLERPLERVKRKEVKRKGA